MRIAMKNHSFFNLDKLTNPAAVRRRQNRNGAKDGISDDITPTRPLLIMLTNKTLFLPTMSLKLPPT